MDVSEEDMNALHTEFIIKEEDEDPLSVLGWKYNKLN